MPVILDYESSCMIQNRFLQIALLTLLFLLTGIPAGLAQLSPLKGPLLKKELPAKSLVLADIDPRDPRLATARTGQKTWVILQFPYLPDAAQKRSLEREGIQLHEYIPGESWLASISGAKSAAQLRQLGARAVIPMNRELRNGRWQKTSKASANTAAGTRDYQLLLVPGSDSNALRDMVTESLRSVKLTATIKRFLTPRLVELQLGEAALEHLLDQGFVLQAMEAPEMKAFTNTAPDIHQSGLVQNGSAGLPSLKGRGVVLGLGDQGQIYHIDHRFNEEGQAYNGAYHSTLMAGIMAGAGIQDPSMRGNAPEARLAVEQFTDILSAAPYYLRQRRMQVTNNSYGVGSACDPVSGLYSTNCWYLDYQVRQHPELLHVFAAGNSGFLQCAGFPEGYKTIDNGFQAAKNVLTVGTTNRDATQFRWSKGPTLDGRIKPEISAIGDGVTATSPNNRYATDYGSSMAAPQVSGALALLIERYRQLNGNQNPRGDLLKAVICNTATDVGVPGVDFANGFGWLNTRAAVKAIEDRSYRQGSVDQGGEWTYTLRINEAVPELKIMLYWHDQPSSLFSYHNLVNDLDLTVQLPDGRWMDPLVPDTSAAGLTAPASPGKDHLNNIEQVVVPGAGPGTYTIRVRGFRVPQGPQDFQVVYHHPSPDWQLLQPAGGETWKPGQLRSIFWEGGSDIPASGLSFHYSINDGASWQQVTGSSTVPGRLEWNIPTLVSTNVKLRVRNNQTGEERISPAFSILPDYNLTLSTACQEQVTLRWRKAAGVDSVQVLQFAGDDFVSLGIVTDTFFTVGNLRFGPDYWFSLSPVKDGRVGERSVAKVTKTRNAACGPTGPAGDISMEKLHRPLTQRQWTMSDAGGIDTVVLTIRNRGTTTTSGPYFLTVQDDIGNSYADTLVRSLNPGASHTWKTDIVLELLPGEARYFQYRISSVTDPEPANNQYAEWWRYLRNDPISVPYHQDFTGLRDTLLGKPGFTGLYGAENWDFNTSSAMIQLLNQASGEVPFRVVSKVAGQKMSLTATYNLTDIDPLDPLRLDLGFRNQDNVLLSIRGSDELPWVQYFDHPLYSVTDFLQLNNQSWGSSFQVKLELNKLGMQDTLDLLLKKVRLFVPTKDLGILYAGFAREDQSVVTAGDTVRLFAIVYNYRKENLGPFDLGVMLPGGTVDRQTVPGIRAFDTARVEFSFVVREHDTRAFRFTVFTVLPGDEYAANDSLAAELKYLQLVNQYPFLEGFEAGRKSWTSSASWELSNTPGAVTNTIRAANGSIFWGNRPAYGDNVSSPRQRYQGGVLESPLFDLSSLARPHLSMSVLPAVCNNNYEIYLDYSLDSGLAWQPFILPVSSGSTNWYPQGDSAWRSCTLKERWQVSSVDLPREWKRVMFRLRMELVGFDRYQEPVLPEGFFMDDFHVFDLEQAVASGSFMQEGTTSPGSWTRMLQGGEVIAAIRPGATGAPYRFETTLDPGRSNISGNPVLPRSWVFRGSPGPDSGTVRLYIPEAELAAWLDAHTCDTCRVKRSAYDLSMFRYAGPEQSLNGLLTDNEEGGLVVWDPGSFYLVPYANGYYAEIPSGAYGEFYFGLNLNMAAVRFKATGRRNPDRVMLEWGSDTMSINRFELERAEVLEGQAGSFQRIHSQTAGGVLDWTFTDNGIKWPGHWQYRLKVFYNDGSYRYSAVRQVHLGAGMEVRAYPVPASQDRLKLLVLQVEGPVELVLTDMSGRQVWRDRKVILPGQEQFDLKNIPRLPAGIYYLQVAAGKEIKGLPLVISGN